MNSALAPLHPLLRRYRAARGDSLSDGARATRADAPPSAGVAPAHCLSPGQAKTLLKARGLRVQVDSGLLYLTEQGDERDHFIRAGRSHTISSQGPVVVEAFGADAVQWRLQQEPASS